MVLNHPFRPALFLGRWWNSGKCIRLKSHDLFVKFHTKRLDCFRTLAVFWSFLLHQLMVLVHLTRTWHLFHRKKSNVSLVKVRTIFGLKLEAFPLLTRHEPTVDTLKAMFCFPLRTWPHRNATYKQVVLAEFDHKSRRTTWISQNLTELYLFWEKSVRCHHYNFGKVVKLL